LFDPIYVIHCQWNEPKIGSKTTNKEANGQSNRQSERRSAIRCSGRV